MPTPEKIVPANETVTALESKPLQTKWWHLWVSGLVGGTLGGGVCYPAESIKKMVQSGQRLPRPWEVRKIYRGFSSFTFTLAPVSMIQVTMCGTLLKIFPKDQYPYLEFPIGMLSGAAGGLVSAPVEHMIRTQQKFNFCRPRVAFNHIGVAGYLTMWTGLGPLLFRETGFGFVMLMAAMAAGDYLAHNYTSTTINLHLLGEIGVGMTGAFLTQPFDTMATRKQNWIINHMYQQNEMLKLDHAHKYEPIKPISMLTAGKQLVSEHGFTSLWKGLVPRLFLFTGCTIVIGRAKNRIGDALSGKTPFFFQSVPAPKKDVEKPVSEPVMHKVPKIS